MHFKDHSWLESLHYQQSAFQQLISQIPWAITATVPSPFPACWFAWKLLLCPFLVYFYHPVACACLPRLKQLSFLVLISLLSTSSIILKSVYFPIRNELVLLIFCFFLTYLLPLSAITTHFRSWVHSFSLCFSVRANHIAMKQLHAFISLFRAAKQHSHAATLGSRNWSILPCIPS